MASGGTSAGKRIADALHKLAMAALGAATLGGIGAAGYGVYSLYVLRPRAHGCSSFKEYQDMLKRQNQAAEDALEQATASNDTQATTENR